ncbi:tetrameric acyl-CoA thioesterase [Leptospira hartskeerlii]|uniref:Tetrameric acyl-CoA thioesterase n=1 Tax=Leptospira hartskeerlii TaxID=2023177 RepID=A0A2M9X9E0_9LEPT|nr:YiiD C-terminal domain-containing protein [Leptospira hartskeerlii]PJZ24162.1 tetrameric acyl-CoA thioesterase [Leptospira hartskeerlii]PJZ35156.1 tetrameric acyl-CoA thioesterase [Leptospira hartskeerlii]
MSQPGFLQRLKFQFFNFYPPYFGAGIKVKALNKDRTLFSTTMKLTPFNKNYVGTQFGGSLYSMCDPFYMLILMEHLGSGYLVWDKAATIRFVKPGEGTVRAEFHIPKEKIQEIKEETDRKRKMDVTFTAQIVDVKTGKLVAEVDKVIYVRKKLKE